MFIVNEMFYNFLYREERLKKGTPPQTTPKAFMQIFSNSL